MDESQELKSIRSREPEPPAPKPAAPVKPPWGDHPIYRWWMENRRPLLFGLLVIGLLITLALLPPDLRLALLGGLLAQRLLLGLLIGFSLLTISLLWSYGQRIDAGVFMYFNRHRLRTRALDLIMWGLTQLGNGLTAFLLAGVFYLNYHRLLALEIVLGTLTLWLVVELIKVLTARSRPYLALAGTKLVGWGERGRSFPSGHTSQTFFLMSLLAFYFHAGPEITFLFYALAFAVGFTRIYLGVHYPRDVLAGAILGMAWGILISLVDPYLSRRFF